jgi:hypothetical protein
LAEKKRRPKGIAARAGKHASKQVKVEFTEHRKQGGSRPSAKKGGRVRKPIPSIRSNRRAKTID